MAKVGVVIPCYNYGQYLEEAIDSVLRQTYTDYEIVVVDDGSNDLLTKHVLRNIDKPKTRVIHIENSGVAVARNVGIEALDCEYILPLDADDKIAATYLEKIVPILDARAYVSIVNSEAEYFGDLSGKIVVEHCNKLPQMLFHNFILVTSLFRKSDWKKVGGFSSKMVDGAEDTDFWISIAALGGMVYTVPETLFYYRIKRNSRQRNFLVNQNRSQTMLQIAANHLDLYREHAEYILAEYYRLESELREYQDLMRRFSRYKRLLDMFIDFKRNFSKILVKLLRRISPRC